jgi:hypothetical protein
MEHEAGTTAVSSLSGSVCTYRSFVRRLPWPRRWRTTWRSAPPGFGVYEDDGGRRGTKHLQWKSRRDQTSSRIVSGGDRPRACIPL